MVWILGAPAVYTFDPETGAAGTTNHAPILWSPRGDLRIGLVESGSTTRITVRGLADEERGALNVTGYVSHVRWATASNQIVFTINRTTSGGVVSQDLYLWDLSTGSPAVRLSQDLRSMGGEFRGSPERYRL